MGVRTFPRYSLPDLENMTAYPVLLTPGYEMMDLGVPEEKNLQKVMRTQQVKF